MKGAAPFKCAYASACACAYASKSSLGRGAPFSAGRGLLGTKGRAFEWAHTPQTTGKGLEPGGAAGQSSVRSGRSVVTPVFGFSEACARAWQDLINGIGYMKKGSTG